MSIMSCAIIALFNKLLMIICQHSMYYHQQLKIVGDRSMIAKIKNYDNIDEIASLYFGDEKLLYHICFFKDIFRHPSMLKKLFFKHEYYFFFLHWYLITINFIFSSQYLHAGNRIGKFRGKDDTIIFNTLVEINTYLLIDDCQFFFEMSRFYNNKHYPLIYRYVVNSSTKHKDDDLIVKFKRKTNLNVFEIIQDAISQYAFTSIAYDMQERDVFSGLYYDISLFILLIDFVATIHHQWRIVMMNNIDFDKDPQLLIINNKTLSKKEFFRTVNKIPCVALFRRILRIVFRQHVKKVHFESSQPSGNCLLDEANSFQYINRYFDKTKLETLKKDFIFDDNIYKGLQYGMWDDDKNHFAHSLRPVRVRLNCLTKWDTFGYFHYTRWQCQQYCDKYYQSVQCWNPKCMKRRYHTKNTTSDDESSKNNETRCIKSSYTKKRFYRCKGCLVARYCSHKCQKMHWSFFNHSIQCKELK